MSGARLELDGWIPYRAWWVDGALTTDWARLGAQPLDAAFFEHSVARMLQAPFNQLFRYRAPECVLRRRAAAHPGLQPSGFIFHMSRCGSTLVSRLLASLAQTGVLSEASPIDSVLQGVVQAPRLCADELALRLGWTITALGQPRRGDEQRLFVKFDSWQMCAWPLILKAFPQTPWIFLYRDPVEVLASQIGHAGIQFTPGAMAPELLGLDPALLHPSMPMEDYAAQVLGSICDAALSCLAKGGGLLVNYDRLPGAFQAIASHFGMRLDDDFPRRREEILAADAKRNGVAFKPRAQINGRRAPPAVSDAAERWVAPLYGRLERLAGGAGA